MSGQSPWERRLQRGTMFCSHVNPESTSSKGQGETWLERQVIKSHLTDTHELFRPPAPRAQGYAFKKESTRKLSSPKSLPALHLQCKKSCPELILFRLAQNTEELPWPSCVTHRRHQPGDMPCPHPDRMKQPPCGDEDGDRKVY